LEIRACISRGWRLICLEVPIIKELEGLGAHGKRCGDIPGIAQGFNRLCVTFDHEHSGHEADKAFVKLFQASFSSVFANKIGKKPDEIISNDTIIQPFHTPFEIDTLQGKIVLNSKKPE
jgi:hypothetical protein